MLRGPHRAVAERVRPRVSRYPLIILNLAHGDASGRTLIRDGGVRGHVHNR